ncbi:ABC transporter permease subunit [Nocardioides sp. dk4132]|uniref:ABC transporter permease n=1 Tax=unclassified Nocardioides TaxID=2615069 RepID=UPI001296DC6E|nr:MULTISPECIES: ABC transporter permease [unclassified Nocardioides]MQW76816.1 ABC transporter permease subunit [Nocardioides sp. dk4132]QGA06834.1 ABC transporter permease subunit [Nocardioides sp. dk884]
MLSYLLRRLGGVVVVLLLVLTMVFLMLHATPGGPETAYLGSNPTPEKRDAVMAQLGLDRPLWLQYLTFVGSVLTLDLGQSLTTGTPVTELLGDRMLVTLELGLVSFVVWTAVGMLAGALAAARRGRLLDGVVRVGSVVALSIPSFWLGLVLVMVFGLYLPGVLPSSGWVPFTEDPVENLRSLVLPAFTLGIGAAAVIARTLRTSMIEALDADHVAFGRALGLPERTILSRLALRNAVIPTLTVLGMMLGTFIGGAVLVENVFNVPGVGQLVVTSFLAHDYPVAIAATVWTAGTFLVTTLVVDLLYFAINPRIRAQFVGGGSR